MRSKEEIKEYQRKYWLKNKKRPRPKKQAWIEDNKDSFDRCRREYREKKRAERIELKIKYEIENKDAIAEQARILKLKNRELSNQRGRKQYAENKGYYAEHAREYNKENRHKKNACLAVFRAIKKGDMIRLPCVECGAENADAHHPDYSKILEVVWLCRSHHKQLHAKAKKILHEGKKIFNGEVIK